jgi:hypothetical protein
VSRKYAEGGANGCCLAYADLKKDTVFSDTELPDPVAIVTLFRRKQKQVWSPLGKEEEEGNRGVLHGMSDEVTGITGVEYDVLS